MQGDSRLRGNDNKKININRKFRNFAGKNKKLWK